MWALWVERREERRGVRSVILGEDGVGACGAVEVSQLEVEWRTGKL